MRDDLVKRLRDPAWVKHWHDQVGFQAADRIEELEVKLAKVQRKYDLFVERKAREKRSAQMVQKRREDFLLEELKISKEGREELIQRIIQLEKTLTDIRDVAAISEGARWYAMVAEKALNKAHLSQRWAPVNEKVANEN